MMDSQQFVFPEPQEERNWTLDLDNAAVLNSALKLSPFTLIFRVRDSNSSPVKNRRVDVHLRIYGASGNCVLPNVLCLNADDDTKLLVTNEEGILRKVVKIKEVSSKLDKSGFKLEYGLVTGEKKMTDAFKVLSKKKREHVEDDEDQTRLHSLEKRVKVIEDVVQTLLKKVLDTA